MGVLLDKFKPATPGSARAIAGVAFLTVAYWYVLPAWEKFQEVADLRSRVSKLSTTSEEFRLSRELIPKDQASGRLAVDLAARARHYGLKVRDLPQPTQMNLGEHLAVETYEMSLVGAYDDVLRFVRDVELGKEKDGSQLDNHSVVHLETLMMKNVEVRNFELSTLAVIRRVVAL